MNKEEQEQEVASMNTRQCPRCGSPNSLGYLASADSVVCSLCPYERRLNPVKQSWFARRKEEVAVKRRELDAKRKERMSFFAPRPVEQSEANEIEVATLKQLTRLANAFEQFVIAEHPEIIDEQISEGANEQ